MSREIERHRSTGTGLCLLGVILAYAIWCQLPTLGHAYLPGWDEAVHAAVAGNLAKHPLTPTLFDQPFVAYDSNNWQANNVWLHMPPLPFWQAALSVGTFGRSFFALRLPTLILFLLTVGGVYLLGLRLYDEKTGLLAALLISACPFAWLQVQGYHFGDMTDVTLAFWLLACVLALERAVAGGSRRWACAAGVFQGFAILTKSALALAPAGAVLLLWLVGAPRRRNKQERLHWSIPAIHWGLAVALAMAWRLYSSVRWPSEFAHEQAALWSHVFSSYEGHGRPWDALFNDLTANLFSPALIVWVLAGAGLVAWLAVKRRSRSIGLHALWMLGTWIPLLVVKTKVPAVLFGMFPALALAAACLLVRATRRSPRAWTSAVLLTPALFLLVSSYTPGDFWKFMRPLTPAMAVWPHLPLQLGIVAVGGLVLWLAGRAIGRHVAAEGRTMKIGRGGWLFLLKAGALVPFVWLLNQSAVTRQGFEIIKDYNPVARPAAAIRSRLRPHVALVIEGVTNGRQRPDLTASFLTGKPAQLVRASQLAGACSAAAGIGEVFLFSPIARRAEAVWSPHPGSGYWVYKLHGPPPEPQLVEPDPSSSGQPVLVNLSSGRDVVPAGSSLKLLARWRITGGRIMCNTRSILVPDAGGEPLQLFPRPDDFPTGFEGGVLQTLAPPGLLWGSRPLGSGLVEQYALRPGELLADGFTSWIPRHTVPGSYHLGLLLKCPGHKETSTPGKLWPKIRVTP